MEVTGNLESGIWNPESEAERVIKLDAETRLSRFEPVQFALLPAVIKHDEEFIAGLQYPPQAALKSDIPRIGIVLHKVGKRRQKA